MIDEKTNCVAKLTEAKVIEIRKLNALLDDYVAVMRLMGAGEANFGVLEDLVDRYRSAVFVHGEARISELLDERMTALVGSADEEVPSFAEKVESSC